MSDKKSNEVEELDLDAPAADLETAMREAEAAVQAAHGSAAVQAAHGTTAAQGSTAAQAEGGTTEDGAELLEAGAAASPAGAGGQGEVDRLRREVAALKDRSMRTLADFDNFRKRSERERQESRRYALLEPLREFVGVVDNLERALSAEGPAEDLKRGVEMILRQMQELLRRHGVREVAALGAPFDPAVHEAVTREESAGVQTPTVAEELQRGYMLHDRLLRPAMVKVAVPAEGDRGAGPAGGAGGAGGDGGNGSVPAL